MFHFMQIIGYYKHTTELDRQGGGDGDDADTVQQL